MKRFVRFLIECGVQVCCLVAAFFALGVPAGVTFWRIVATGVALGIFVHVEKRQWRRKSNANLHRTKMAGDNVEDSE